MRPFVVLEDKLANCKGHWPPLGIQFNSQNVDSSSSDCSLSHVQVAWLKVMK